MAVYDVTAGTPGTLITSLNRDLNVMVCTDGTVAVTIAKDAAGTTPLFKMPIGISAVTFCTREDLCGPLYAISALAVGITVNTWR